VEAQALTSIVATVIAETRGEAGRNITGHELVISGMLFIAAAALSIVLTTRTPLGQLAGGGRGVRRFKIALGALAAVAGLVQIVAGVAKG
jgi:hypothetical protein